MGGDTFDNMWDDLDQTYHEILILIKEGEDYWASVEEEMDSHPGANWVCTDLSTRWAIFTNYCGETRTISAEYINQCFEEENDG